MNIWAAQSELFVMFVRNWALQWEFLALGQVEICSSSVRRSLIVTPVMGLKQLQSEI